MTGDILAYLALFIAGTMALFTTSRLSLYVFIFLVVWFFADLALSLIDSYYVYPALFIGILIDYGLLLWLSMASIRCIIVPIVTAFSALYAAVCLITEYFGIPAMLDQYGLIMGLTALLASFEGAYHGFVGRRRAIFDDDRGNSGYPWHEVGIHTDKKGL